MTSFLEDKLDGNKTFQNVRIRMGDVHIVVSYEPRITQRSTQVGPEEWNLGLLLYEIPAHTRSLFLALLHFRLLIFLKYHYKIFFYVRFSSFQSVKNILELLLMIFSHRQP